MAFDIRFQSSLFHNAWVENETKEDGLGDENMNINTSAGDYSVFRTINKEPNEGIQKNLLTYQLDHHWSLIQITKKMMMRVTVNDYLHQKLVHSHLV